MLQCNNVILILDVIRIARYTETATYDDTPTFCKLNLNEAYHIYLPTDSIWMLIHFHFYQYIFIFFN